VIQRLGLGAAADRRAGHLSLGNKQRLALARALVHTPDLLVLDEPANALDPAGIVEIRELLRSLADDQGATVFVSSHILSEVAQLADRIGIVHEGKLIEELDRAALVSAAQAFSAEQLTAQQRADALLTLELERYFLARTGGVA
jgi:ABC-type multidrug transport system ATPase subunit